MTFDSLEDRRLLAGLNVFVYDDANGSGGWDSPAELPIAEQVVYVDQDNDGRLGNIEPYSITDANGKALIDNLATGIAILRLLGSSGPIRPVNLTNPDLVVDVNLASRKAVGNSAPTLSGIPGQSVDEEGTLNLDSSILQRVASDANDDPLSFFVVGKPANGSLLWSIEAGGTYEPNKDYYGTDTILVRAFDGKAWSAAMPLVITINNVDDLPTAIEFTGDTVPENQQGFVIGPITIIDVDGGPNTIRVSPEDLFEVQDGKLKLASGKSLDFEAGSTSSVTIDVIVGESDDAVLSMTAFLPVQNRNDAPSALIFEGEARVQEFIEGFEFGTIRVADDDVGEQYNFVVSDNRFVVADGKLALKPATSLVFADGPVVSVTVTAVSRTTSESVSGTVDIQVVRGAPPWQNKHWALDVNNDGILSPVDVLIVINALNRIGTQPLDRLPPGSETFVDVNGDRFLSPIDALILINALNTQSRGSGGGSSNGSGSGGGSNGGGIGEGEGSVPSAPPQVAGDPNQRERFSQPINVSNSLVAIDDDSMLPSQARKSTRRVR